MLSTEMRNERTMHIDQMSIYDALKTINDENSVIQKAINDALPQIEAACKAMVEAIQNGGKVYYIGCGTSGRLGVLDAVECPPTFGVSSELFTGIIAGGYGCLVTASENAEDQSEKGVDDLKQRNVCPNDIVIGISAAGGAAYVENALKYARRIGAKTVAISNNPDTPIGRTAEISICLLTGPEVVAGSTRMKAGTSQKIVLNMLSTVAMIQCGNVYENLMINLRPTNLKLTNRVISIVCELTGLSKEDSEKLLAENDWNIRKAVTAFRGTNHSA